MAKAKRPSLSVVDAIDRALHTLSARASGAELGSVVDTLSKGLAKGLLTLRETAEALEAVLTPEDAPHG